MSKIEAAIETMQFNRLRTLGLLKQIEESDAGTQALAWRPGTGRAHMAWQFMHIGITEELFATERLNPEKPGQYTELWERFRGGSTPDDDIPAAKLIHEVLESSRERLIDTLRGYTEEDLPIIPPSFAERGLTLQQLLHVLCWHEAHHQGQAHITLNLFKNQ